MRKSWGVFIILLGFTMAPALGQSQSTTADLAGTITDQTGALLPGVDVSARNQDTGFQRVAVSDDTGTYRLPLLPPGEYELRAELAGFTTTILQGVRLSVGQYANLDIQLQVSGEQTEIVVTTNASIVEKEKTVQASTVDQVEIQNLPINGRNFLDFTLLTPGVSDRFTLTDFGVPQTPTSGLSFAGQDQRSTYVTIDGADNVDVISNSVRSTLSQEAIQEFQISRNSFAAEFGRARGGVINIVSKSGTNDFHGSGFFFIRHDALDARNTFARAEDPQFERYQYGGTFGGPIRQDTTFFFASYEGQDRDESLFVTFLDDEAIFRPTPSQLDLFGFLGSTGIPSLQFLAASFVDPRFGVLHTLDSNFPETLELFRSESGTFPFVNDSDTLSVKLDHIFSPNNSFYARANFTDAFNNGLEFGALQGVSNGVSFDSRDFTFVASDSHIFSPVTLNDFKFQYSRREFAVPTRDPVGPELLLDGVAIFGREFNNPTAYQANIFQWVDNFTFIRGNHTFKTGVDAAYWDLEGFADVFGGGQYRFGEVIPLASIIDNALGPGTAAGLITQLSTPVAAGGLGRPDLVPNVLAPISTLQSFNFGLPITYLQTFGDPTDALGYTQLALYFQDSWRVRDNFTFNWGVRYDTDWRAPTLNIVSETPPFQLEEGSVTDRNNFAPRLGVAWDPFNNKKMVVRAGFGLFYGNFFQSVGFVGRVLSGRLFQVFLPITGLPGFEVTSADLFGLLRETGVRGEEALDFFGIQPGTTPSGILPTAPDVQNPYSTHSSLGLEFELAPDWALSLDYLLNKGTGLIRSRDINVRQVGPNRFALPGLDPRFLQVGMVETSGSSIYHGFTAALRKRFSRHYALQVAYTLGKSIDDAVDFTTQNQANNQNDLRAERGLSVFDQRQRLVVSGIWESPFRSGSADGFRKKFLADWVVAPIITWGSGRPFNLLTGFDLNNDSHANTDRPVLVDGNIAGRNTGRGPTSFVTDLRVSRKFRFRREDLYFEFIFEAFNLFNNVNYSGVNATVGQLPLTTSTVEASASIPANQPLGFTAARDPRQIQFGFKLVF